MKVLGIGIIFCLVWSPQARAQVFPGAVAGDKDLYVAVGGVSTTITSAVTAGTTTFTVASVANMQPYELLVVDNEIVEECAFSAGTLQISIGKNSCPGADGRGIGGTSPASHANGTRIMDLITAEHHNATRKEIKAIEMALGTNLANIPGTANGPATPISKGGTGATTQAGALSNILGVSPLPANGLCFTNGAGPANCLPPGALGTVLTSTGPASLPNWQPGGGTGGVSSVFGRMGTVAAQAGDYTAALVTNAVDQTQTYANPPWLTSLAWSKITGAPTFVTNPMISAGDFIVGGASGTPVRLPVPGTGTFCANWAAGGAVTWITCPGGGGSGITSVGITMPSAFNVTGSPLTSNGVISITGAGNASQYINGLGQLATLPPSSVTSVFGRTGAVVAASGDYTTTQVTEGTNLYYTNARVYASLSAMAPIQFSAGVISCPTCGTGGAGAVTSVFGRMGVVVAVTGDYNATQVTNAENVLNKDTNGGYVGRSSVGSATLPATVTALQFQSSDTTHTSLVSLVPGLSSNFGYSISSGQWGLFLDTSNGNKLTRRDSLGNNVVIEQAATLVTGQPYVQTFTSATTVALTHNMNLSPATAFNIDCFDSTGALVFPSNVTATSANTVTVTFAVASSGSCTITTGGTGASGGTGNVTGPGTTTTLYVPQWNNTTGTQLSAGLPVTQANAANSLVETGAGGTIAAGTTGNASSATQLAVTPTQCSAGQFATGIAASGNANCASVAGPAVGAVNHVQTTNGSGSLLDGGCTMVASVLTCGSSLILSGAETALASVTTPTIRVDSTTHNMELTKAGDATADFVGVVPVATPGTSGGATLFLTNINAAGSQGSAAIKTTDLPTVNSAPGSCGDATHVCQVTTTGNGLVTSQSAIAITAGGGGGSSVGAVNHIQTSNGSGSFLDGGCTIVSSVLNCPSLILSGASTALASVSVPTIRIDSTTGNMELTQAGNATADFVGLVPVASPQIAGGSGATLFVTNITAAGVQSSNTIQPSDLPSVTTFIYTASQGPEVAPYLPSAYGFNNATGAIIFTLPTATRTGLQRCYRQTTGRSGIISIAVTTGDRIDLNGVNGTLSTGTLVSGGALGDAVCLVSDVSNHWMAYVQRGTWTNN